MDGTSFFSLWHESQGIIDLDDRLGLLEAVAEVRILNEVGKGELLATVHRQRDVPSSPLGLL